MSDLDYSICHKDALPEYLEERWNKPRPVGDNHLLYRGQCEATECAYQSSREVDEEGNPLVSVGEVVAAVEAIMATEGHAPIILCKQHAQAVLAVVCPAPEVM